MLLIPQKIILHFHITAYFPKTLMFYQKLLHKFTFTPLPPPPCGADYPPQSSLRGKYRGLVLRLLVGCFANYPPQSSLTREEEIKLVATTTSSLTPCGADYPP
jgi:hypothetical protein